MAQVFNFLKKYQQLLIKKNKTGFDSETQLNMLNRCPKSHIFFIIILENGTILLSESLLNEAQNNQSFKYSDIF